MPARSEPGNERLVSQPSELKKAIGFGAALSRGGKPHWVRLSVTFGQADAWPRSRTRIGICFFLHIRAFVKYTSPLSPNHIFLRHDDL